MKECISESHLNSYCKNKTQIDQDMMNKDILFLYKNMKNHLIILNPVSKILPLAEEEQG